MRNLLFPQTACYLDYLYKISWYVKDAALQVKITVNNLYFYLPNSQMLILKHRAILKQKFIKHLCDYSHNGYFFHYYTIDSFRSTTTLNQTKLTYSTTIDTILK